MNHKHEFEFIVRDGIVANVKLEGENTIVEPGHKLWDKYNNIISLSHMFKSKLKYMPITVITEMNYNKFINMCKGITEMYGAF